MTPQRERLLRTGLAAVAVAVASLVLVSGYHPCEGIGPLFVVAPICGVVTLASGLPSFRTRTMLVPGAAVAAVVAVAIGLDYSNSGMVTEGLDQCEPVPGIAGFLLAGLISGIMALLGVACALLLAWVAHRVLRQQSGPSESQGAPGVEGNHG